MKKVYEAPVVHLEQFVANEYIAACDSGTVYKFTCDAGGGERGDVFTSTGENLTRGSRKYYHACNQTHEASTQDDFIEGTLVFNGGNDQTGGYVGMWPFGHYEDYESTPVIIWTDGGTNVHCTTELDMENWKTDKS